MERHIRDAQEEEVLPVITLLMITTLFNVILLIFICPLYLFPLCRWSLIILNLVCSTAA